MNFRGFKTSKPRVAIFASHYAGFFTLRQLLDGPISDQIEVCLVATDDPHNPVCNPSRRIWKYGFTEEEATMVDKSASAYDIFTWTGDVSTEKFYRTFIDAKPNMAIMACFGQRIPPRLVEVVNNQFWNVHPAVMSSPWPNFQGADVWEQLIAAKQSCFAMCVHEVIEAIDAGPDVCWSEPVPIPPNSTPVSLNLLAGPATAIIAEIQIDCTFDLRKKLIEVTNEWN